MGVIKIWSSAFCFLVVVVFLPLTGCGKEGREKPEDSLKVLLAIPQEESPELFWYGVTHRQLQINTSKSETITQQWVPGQRFAGELSAGDTLIFQGLDRDGRVLVRGAATVEQSKIVSIPLQRVL